MNTTRRSFVRTVAGGAALAGSVATMVRADEGANLDQILDSFAGLPGTLAIKLWAPSTAGEPEFLLQQNEAQQMLVGSSIKAFVLCKRMRQLDSPNILTALTSHEVPLNASVWATGSATFNPPNLIGKVTERTAMEAMILHSDNTGADMELRQTGPDNVRAFLASAGRSKSAIPNSIRTFIGYIFGATNYLTFTWEDLVALPANAPLVNSPLNEVQTLASSADDLVSFWSRSIQGEFFKNSETLQQYRNVLRLGDVIPFVVPLGATAFAKGGEFDAPGFHALSAPGAMFFNGRWVYFSVILNWFAPAATDPETFQQFVAATQQALALLYHGLGGR